MFDAEPLIDYLWKRAQMVRAVEGTTTVRIWQVNTSRLIVAQVPVKDGEPVEEGTFTIDGLPFPGAEVQLEYHDPGGSITGRPFE